MNSIGRSLVLVCIGSMSMGACASGERPTLAAPVGEAVPPPTIGIDTDLGLFADGAEIRRIDTGDIESVVMIGDSITVGAKPMIEAQFSTLGFSNVDIIAQELKRTAVSFGGNSSGADVASAAAGEEDRGDDQLWVVALGTNDIGQYGSADDVEAEIRSVLEQIPDEAPVVWINTYFAARPEDTSTVNTAIDRAVSERGNAVVGRWDAIAGTDGVLSGDGVHPSTEGAGVFARFVSATVADFLAS